MSQRMISSLVLSFAFILVALSAGADTAKTAPVPQAPLDLTADNLAKVIDPPMLEWCNKHNGPGAVVVVVKNDTPVFAKGYGFSDIKAKKPFSADATLVRPGSISKLFTGIAVMQLVDEGKLELDRDVNDYLDFSIPTPQGGVPVTLRRLLTHRAGFEEHLKGVYSRAPEPAPLGLWLARSLPVRLFPKGDIPAYSNYGLSLAGYIVERVSGEPFAAYIQHHILEPLGMRHSTFQQPLPNELAALMAKSYKSSNEPPQAFFTTVVSSPAGALSATGADMGRFMQALLNGGALGSARILSKQRLDEMMAPKNATPAGFFGLVFAGTKIAGRDAIGHDGFVRPFASDLEMFAKQGMGIFVCRDGAGNAKEANAIPDPVQLLAEHFLPSEAGEAKPVGAALSGEEEIVGVYHGSRRADSSFMKLVDFLSEGVIARDSDGNARAMAAIWPFGKALVGKHLGPRLYELPHGRRISFQLSDDSNSSFIMGATAFQRVPWHLDARLIAPVVVASLLIALVTVMAWPVTDFLRRRRPSWQSKAVKRMYLSSRSVLAVDIAVVAIVAAVPLTIHLNIYDLTMFNETLDPFIFVFYVMAWLGAFGAIPAVWIAVQFWRKRLGSRWSRIHQTLIAASAVVLAWFFITFHFAGTTFNY